MKRKKGQHLAFSSILANTIERTNERDSSSYVFNKDENLNIKIVSHNSSHLCNDIAQLLCYHRWHNYQFCTSQFPCSNFLSHSVNIKYQTMSEINMISPTRFSHQFDDLICQVMWKSPSQRNSQICFHYNHEIKSIWRHRDQVINLSYQLTRENVLACIKSHITYIQMLVF